MTVTRYDRTGRTYAHTRRPDPRIAATIGHALSNTESVANIGAGTGSYEPAQTIVAVEPSRVMIAQRAVGAAPILQAVAEHLPLRDNAVDAALAVLSVHHWDNLEDGIAEMTRVARRRVVIFTWDSTIFRRFWLLGEYLPAVAATDAQSAVPISRLTDLLGDATSLPVPVPHDCCDGFGGAYWRRPQAYLDPRVRAGMSVFSLTPAHLVREGLSRLRSDLASGEWHRRHGALLRESELDLGYRLIVG